MAIRKSQKVKPPKVIEAISEFAGALVGTAVVTGKRIVKTAAQADEVPSPKPRKKTAQTPTMKKKKTAVKTKVKGRKVKKKVAKKKSTGLGHKGKTSIKGSAQPTAKKQGAPV